MRFAIALLTTVLLLGLAALPWVIASCAPDPMLPQALLTERTQYDTVVVTAQAATIEAQRAAPSQRRVVIAGTVEATIVITAAVEVGATVVPIPTLAASEPLTTTSAHATPTSVVQATAPAHAVQSAASSAITVIGRTVLTATDALSSTAPLTQVVVVQSHAPAASSVKIPTKTSSMSSPISTPTSSAPPVPAGLSDVTDVLTTQMLAEQVARDMTDLPLQNVLIDLSDRGFSATAQLVLIPGFPQPVSLRGNFAVADNSLVAEIDAVTHNGRDVTEQYRGAAEARINSSLYRLLPQRYVADYAIDFGQLVVHSKGTPP